MKREDLVEFLDRRYRAARSLTDGSAHSCGCAARHRLENRLPRQGFQWETGGQGARNVLLLHGTTAGAGNQIRSQGKLSPQTTYLAVGWGNRELARIFALRASSRRPRDGGPAVVLVSLPPEIFERLRSLRLIRAIQFDAQDQPALRNRTQWVLEPGGVELVNRGAERFAVVPVSGVAARSRS